MHKVKHILKFWYKLSDKLYQEHSFNFILMKKKTKQTILTLAPYAFIYKIRKSYMYLVHRLSKQWRGLD